MLWLICLLIVIVVLKQKIKNIENTLKYLDYTPALKRALFSKLALFEGENITSLNSMDKKEEPKQLSEKGRQIINFYEKNKTNRTRK